MNQAECRWNTDKEKTRLVAREFNQRSSVDYIETFAPVCRIKSIRLWLALAVEMDVKIHQPDVSSAYLNGDIAHEIYMNLPNLTEETLDDITKINASGKQK